MALLLCTQGFGADTDAWLLVRTALKVAQGDGYDPARSLGNPAYEFLLTGLFPFVRLGLLPNLLNLLLALAFLWRLPHYFPMLSGICLNTFRMLLGLQLWWLECATSTLEFMPAWLLAFEALNRFHQNPKGWLPLGIGALAVAFRLEFALFFLLACWPIRSIQRFRFWLFIVFLLLPALYVASVWGRNPLPFSGPSGFIMFCLARHQVLFFQAGFQTFWIWACLLFWFLKWRSSRDQNPLSRFAWFNALFFLFFPFEWAYAGPAIVVAQATLWTGFSAHQRRLSLAGVLLGMLPFHFGFKSGFIPGLWQSRMEIKRIYEQAQKARPAQPTLWLFGATWLSTQYSGWEEVLPARLFRKNGSQLYVAERLTHHELDSLYRSGFKLVGHTRYKSDNAQHAQIRWVRTKDL